MLCAATGVLLFKNKEKEKYTLSFFFSLVFHIFYSPHALYSLPSAHKHFQLTNPLIFSLSYAFQITHVYCFTVYAWQHLLPSSCCGHLEDHRDNKITIWLFFILSCIS